jgi:acetyl-CoA carboxylase carboxyltransferase component
VVFNKALHPDLRMLALADTKVSVIGGSAAAEVVLTGLVKARMAKVAAERPELDEAALRRAARAEVAAEFDAVHSVERAFATRSVDEVIEPSRLRPTVAAYLRAHAERPEARGRAEVTDLRPRALPSADRPAASA